MKEEIENKYVKRKKTSEIKLIIVFKERTMTAEGGELRTLIKVLVRRSRRRRRKRRRRKERKKGGAKTHLTIFPMTIFLCTVIKFHGKIAKTYLPLSLFLSFSLFLSSLSLFFYLHFH